MRNYETVRRNGFRYDLRITPYFLYFRRHFKYAGHLLQDPLSLARIVTLNGGRDATAQMIVQDDGADLVQGCLHGLDLLDHVDAVGIVFDHSLDAFDMPGGAGQSPANVFFSRLVHSFANPALYSFPTPLGGDV